MQYADCRGHQTHRAWKSESRKAASPTGYARVPLARWTPRKERRGGQTVLLRKPAYWRIRAFHQFAGTTGYFEARVPFRSVRDVRPTGHCGLELHVSYTRQAEEIY